MLFLFPSICANIFLHAHMSDCMGAKRVVDKCKWFVELISMHVGLPSAGPGYETRPNFNILVTADYLAPKGDKPRLGKILTSFCQS